MESVNIVVNPLPTVDAGLDVEITLGTSISLSATGLGSFSWTPPNGLSCVDCPDPTAAPEQTTTYTITLTDANGCVNTDEVTVEVTLPTSIYLPNAFSPDGNGVNDVFSIIQNQVLELVVFEVYNRWGEIIFHTTDINEGWDGTFSGKEQEMDTYIYLVQVIEIDHKTHSYTGNVTLLR
jgi:gliding motility-associated-like protein